MELFQALVGTHLVLVPLDENERKHLKVMGQKYTEAGYSLNTAHKNKICINDADIFMISVQGVLHLLLPVFNGFYSARILK